MVSLPKRKSIYGRKTIMAKGNYFGGGGMPNMGGMMKQVQKMMADTQRIEEELGEMRIETSSGGGMVKAVANGKGEFIDIQIDKSVVDPEDVEMLQDLIVSAVREAMEQGAALKASKLEAITGGLNIPGLM